MKKKELEFVEDELMNIHAENQDVWESIRFKENLTIGIIAGVTVVVIFKLYDYLVYFGIIGFAIFIILMFTLIKIFTRKEKKRIKNIKRRLEKLHKKIN